jgi:cleavage stimulation factor subunit 1
MNFTGEMPNYEEGNVIRTREIMYRLIISQLFYDGYSQAAIQLTNILAVDPPAPPSERLLHVVVRGLDQEAEEKAQEDRVMKKNAYADLAVGPTSRTEILESLHNRGLDLEFDTDSRQSNHEIVPEPAMYETAYVTSHKANCRAGAFNADGSLVATGSLDTSIKILDVDRMLAKSQMESMASGNKTIDPGSHPVIRTLYDHVEEVTCLRFHPREPLLASGSRDFTVKIFDYSKASAKKAFKTISETEHIEDLAFHPTGSHLLVGVRNPIIRMYDVNTTQCYTGSLPHQQHHELITSLDWSMDGKLYASASIDGAIKIWDGVSSHCVSTYVKAHDGHEVSSVRFTRNGKYVLSSGKDSLIKLWELSTNRCLIAYTGAGATGKQEFPSQAVFNHTEDYVMFPDEMTTSLCCWDSRNASRKQLLSLGHNGAVRFITHSPTEAAFLTCSDDFRARFWFKRPMPSQR